MGDKKALRKASRLLQSLEWVVLRKAFLNWRSQQIQLQDHSRLKRVPKNVGRAIKPV